MVETQELPKGPTDRLQIGYRTFINPVKSQLEKDNGDTICKLRSRLLVLYRLAEKPGEVIPTEALFAGTTRPTNPHKYIEKLNATIGQNEQAKSQSAHIVLLPDGIMLYDPRDDEKVIETSLPSLLNKTLVNDSMSRDTSSPPLEGITNVDLGNGLIYYPMDFCVIRKQDGKRIRFRLKKNRIIFRLVLNNRQTVPYEKLLDDGGTVAERLKLRKSLHKTFDADKGARNSILTHNKVGLMLSIPERNRVYERPLRNSVINRTIYQRPDT